MSARKISGESDLLARGIYSNQLEMWFRYFEKKQFLIIRSEDMFRDPSGVYERVLEFLHLRPIVPCRFANDKQTTHPPMSSAVRAKLESFYMPSNARLYELVERDFEWD